MKQFYLLLLALFCQSIFAQNWQPLMQKDTINFKHKDSLFTTQTVWVETFYVPNTGDTTFILNETLHHFDSPNSFCTDGIARHIPHFLQKQAIKKVDSTWLFQSPNVSYVFKPFAALNDIWLFDSLQNITANVLTIDTFSVVGQLDSIKIIGLSSGDSILLSKNYGLMRFPTFDSTLYVSWAGIENRNIGERVWGFREIFDFEVGDVFYYFVHHSTEGVSASPYYYQINQKVKMNVMGKMVGLNSVSYQYHVDMQTENLPHYPTWTYVITFENFDTTIIYNSNYLYSAYPLGKAYLYTDAYNAPSDSNFKCNYAQIKWDNLWNCWTKSILFRDYSSLKGYNYWRTDTLWGGGCFEQGSDSKVKYGKGIGLIAANNYAESHGLDILYYYHDTTLVGYIKNGISVGTIYPDWQFTDIENPHNEAINLSPNPAKDQLFISLSKGNSVNIRIWDMQGREKSVIDSQNNSITLTINDWAKGLYFVEVRDEKGNVFTEKFVKE